MSSRLLMLTLILASVQGAYATGSRGLICILPQSRATVSDELLKSLEKALAELESARKVNSLQRDQLDALEAKISALNDLLRLERERAEAYRVAAAERASANVLDDKRVALYEQSLLSFREETTRLRSERDSARRANKVWGAVGLILGIGAALWGSK
jgi:hypothetical protein